MKSEYQTGFQVLINGIQSDVLLLSGHNKKGTNTNNKLKKAFVRKKKYVWCKNKDYAGGATCGSSNSLFKELQKMSLKKLRNLNKL